MFHTNPYYSILESSEPQIVQINLDTKWNCELKDCELWNFYFKKAEGSVISAVSHTEFFFLLYLLTLPVDKVFFFF